MFGVAPGVATEPVHPTGTEPLRVSVAELAKASTGKYPSTTEKDAPPHGTSGNGMPGISDRSVLQPSSGGGSIVGQGMDSGQDGVANFGVNDIARIKASAIDWAHQSMTNTGKMSLWDKTVGAMCQQTQKSPCLLLRSGGCCWPRLGFGAALPRRDTAAHYERQPF